MANLPAKQTFLAEIASIIKKLANNKSQVISSKVVKNLPTKVIVHLTHIYNAALRLSYFPTTWKLSVIVTVPKPVKPPG